MKRTVFHTVKSTPDKGALIKNAPFRCKDKSGELKEWLGEGYYFWETFEELPHWWGKVRYRFNDLHYVICKTDFDCPDNELLDLVSDTETIADIKSMVVEMKKHPSFKAVTFTAQFIINFIRKKTPFSYKAIRAYGRDASSDKNITQHIYYFSMKSSIHFCPEIQICVIDKSVLKLPMEIHYCSEDDSFDSLTV